MNGGLAVDTWGATSLEGCYAVGEAAGTHGVTRPAAPHLMPARCSARAARSISRPGGSLAIATKTDKPFVEEAVAGVLDAPPERQRAKGDGRTQRGPGPDQRPCRNPVQCEDVRAAAEAAHALNEIDPPAGNSLRRRQRGASGASVAAERPCVRSSARSVGLLS